MTKLALPLLALTLVAGCTAAADETPGTASSGKSCFFPRTVSGFREAPESAAGDPQVYVDVGARDTYLFETFGNCPDLDFATRIAFDQRVPGAICDGLDVDLLVPTVAGGFDRCPVHMIRKLGEGEPGSRR